MIHSAINLEHSSELEKFSLKQIEQVNLNTKANYYNLQQDAQFKQQQLAHWQQDIEQLLNQIEDYLTYSGLNYQSNQLHLQHIRQLLQQQHLTIALIAEFSRGKSEFINALLFGAYKKRILPTSSGRTTMCPTELFYDKNTKPYIKLLPIQTYNYNGGTEELFAHEHIWHHFDLDINNAQPELSDLSAFEALKQTIQVTQEEASNYGFFDSNNPDHLHYIQSNGLVEISKWRHALINLPHPLLENGIRILDTPGLNAIGSEPELALRLIPNADMIMFILAADTGVTKSDLDLWLNYMQPHQRKQALVILNKIDTLWSVNIDKEDTIDVQQQEIAQQMLNTAKYLQVDASQIYPLSAKQGLLAKVQKNENLYATSGLCFFEYMLKEQLIPQQKQIIVNNVANLIQKLLDVCKQSILEQKNETSEAFNSMSALQVMPNNMGHFNLNTSNDLEHEYQCALIEQEELQMILLDIQNMRLELNEQSVKLLELSQTSQIERLKQKINEQKLEVKQGIEELFKYSEQVLEQSSQYHQTIVNNIEQMYAQLNTVLSYHLNYFDIQTKFNFEEYALEFKKIWKIYEQQIILNQTKFSKKPIEKRFFDTMSSRLKQWLMTMHEALDAWLKAQCLPLDEALHKQQKRLQRKTLTLENMQHNEQLFKQNLQDLSFDLQKIDKSLIQLQNFSTELGFIEDAYSVCYQLKPIQT